jgi:hypothetical protein
VGRGFVGKYEWEHPGSRNELSYIYESNQQKEATIKLYND